VSAEFNWWLLLVGLVVGTGLAWLVLADLGPSGRDRPSLDPADEETELQLEADWIAARFEERGRAVDRETLTEALALDRLYRTPDVRLAPTRPREPRRERRSSDPDDRTIDGPSEHDPTNG
jgi:hypothetical protein